MRTHRTFALAIALLIGTSAYAADDCAARLAGDRYYGAVRARVQAGQLGTEELRKLVASDVPLNPAANETPGSKNASAIRLFESLRADAQVLASWRETRARLQTLLNEQEGRNRERERAADKTIGIFNPRELGTIANTAIRYSMAELPDGRAVLAHTRFPNFVAVTDITAQKEIWSIQLPVTKMINILVEWHRDSSGQLWLYLGGNVADSEELNVYRLKWGESRFTRIKPAAGVGQLCLISLKSAAPGLIVAIASGGGAGRDHYFQLDSGRFKEFSEEDAFTVAVKSNPPAGASVRPRRLSSILFKTTSGTLYFASADPMTKLITIKNLGGNVPDIVMRMPIESTGTYDLSFFEKDEHLYFAVLVQGHGIQIYEPLVSTDPIVDAPANFRSDPRAHWFHSPMGDLLLGVPISNQKEEIRVFDISVRNFYPDVALPAQIDGWLTHAGQTYFTIRAREQVRVFSVFNPP